MLHTDPDNPSICKGFSHRHPPAATVARARRIAASGVNERNAEGIKCTPVHKVRLLDKNADRGNPRRDIFRDSDEKGPIDSTDPRGQFPVVQIIAVMEKLDVLNWRARNPFCILQWHFTQFHMQ